MMLVQLPAMDAVSLSVRVPGLSLPAMPPSLVAVANGLSRPSFWLVLLASLVILSSFRAALLYVRRPTHKATVSFVALTTEKAPQPSIPTASISSGSATQSSPAATEKPRQTSWLWGLVKWDALPALPVVRGRGTTLLQDRRWMQHGQQQQQQQMQQVAVVHQQGRRMGPAFDRPMPAVYQTEAPVSMAKMIMSRHTFRRPTSRPPPVRSANAVQYQRRSPSMV